MNNQEKQNEILKELKDKKLGVEQNKDDYIQGSAMLRDLNEIKQKAKAHKKEVEKEEYNLRKIIITKSLTKFEQECLINKRKDCQKILDKYSEVGV